jgi:replicative DNA helicase
MADPDNPQDENVIPHPSAEDTAAKRVESKPGMSPPQNLEAEQGLLGALLRDNNMMQEITDSLKEDHFYDPVHGRIFAAISTLTSTGRLADPVTLKSYLVGDAAFDQLDIETYLVDLSETVAFLSDAPDYANEVRQCFLRRSLISVSESIARNAQTADLDVTAETQIEEAEQQLFTLAESDQFEQGLEPFRNPLARTIQMAELARSNPGGIPGIPTHLKRLNEKLGGLQRSDLIILAGRPGMGKSALAANFAFHAATSKDSEENPRYIAFFSLEMSSEQIVTRILSEKSGISSEDIRRGNLTPDEFTSLVEATGQLETAPIYIDDTAALSVSQVASRARRLKRKEGLSLIVVDYLQLLTRPLDQKAPENRVYEISAITRTLKSMAKELDVPVVALSQLSRNVEQRDDKRPVLADLRESGSIEQDADVVLFLYRQEYYDNKGEPEQKQSESNEDYQNRIDDYRRKLENSSGLAEIIIAKQRQGPTGTIEVKFIAEQTKFTDYLPPDHLPESH